MLRFTLQRLLTGIPTLLVLTALAFFLIRAAPGGPFDTERQLPPEIEANMRRAYHLDEPLVQQFGRYLWNLAHGDFGPSFQYRDRTVTELIARDGVFAAHAWVRWNNEILGDIPSHVATLGDGTADRA